MFEALTEKLNGVFHGLGNKGRLTENDIDAALREVRMALLEADVNFRVAREFVATIRERVFGEGLLQERQTSDVFFQVGCQGHQKGA